MASIYAIHELRDDMGERTRLRDPDVIEVDGVAVEPPPFYTDEQVKFEGPDVQTLARALVDCIVWIMRDDDAKPDSFELPTAVTLAATEHLLQVMIEMRRYFKV